MKQHLLNPLKKSAMLIAAMGASLAATASPGPYIGLEGGVNFQRDQRVERNNQTLFTNGFNDGYVGGLVVGQAFASGFRPELELMYRRNKFDELHSTLLNTSDVAGDENAYTAMGNLWLDIRQPSGFFSVVHPYIGGGVGVARVQMHKPTVMGSQGPNSFDTRFAFQGGAGVSFDISPQVSMSLDYRNLRTDKAVFRSNAGPIKARYRADSALLGVRYSFGLPAAPVVARAPEPAPAPEVMQPMPPPPAPRDSDGDGVIDALDRCAATPRGFRVDTIGCVIEQTVTLRGINFMFNSDQLTAPAQDTLNEVSAALVSQPALNIQIIGNTDSLGSADYNQRLSQERADSVRHYLISRGVDAGNLQSRGDGESNPVASNDTEKGRAENRRVQFNVLNKPDNVKVQSAESSSQSKSAAGVGEPKYLKDK